MVQKTIDLYTISDRCHPPNIKHTKIRELIRDDEKFARYIPLVLLKIVTDTIDKIVKFHPDILFYEGTRRISIEDVEEARNSDDPTAIMATALIAPDLVYKVLHNPDCVVVHLDKGFSPYEQHQRLIDNGEDRTDRSWQVGREEYWTHVILRHITNYSNPMLVVGAAHLDNRMLPERHIGNLPRLLLKNGIIIRDYWKTPDAEVILARARALENPQDVQIGNQSTAYGKLMWYSPERDILGIQEVDERGNPISGPFNLIRNVDNPEKYVGKVGIMNTGYIIVNGKPTGRFYLDLTIGGTVVAHI